MKESLWENLRGLSWSRSTVIDPWRCGPHWPGITAASAATANEEEKEGHRSIRELRRNRAQVTCERPLILSQSPPWGAHVGGEPAGGTAIYRSQNWHQLAMQREPRVKSPIARQYRRLLFDRGKVRHWVGFAGWMLHPSVRRNGHCLSRGLRNRSRFRVR